MSGLIFDSDIVKDEYRGEWAKSVKKHANFFKHAREDPYGTVEFNANINDYIILFSIKGLRRMEGAVGKEESLFIYWTLVKHPDLLKEGAHDTVPADLVNEFRHLNKREFSQVFYSTFGDQFD